MGTPIGLWLRWSWRDVRHHWVAVLAIAMVVAIGTGVYAGLGSTATWRRQSNDASFAALQMHDVRVGLTTGTFAPEGSLSAAAASIAGADDIEAAVERLIVESQVEADTEAGSVLVAARVQGSVELADAAVDAIWLRDGREPEPNSGRSVLEVKFADHHGLPASGSVEVAEGRSVAYSGLGIAPEDFYYEGPQGTLFGEGELAVLYTHLADAQNLIGRPGEVNDLVLRLREGADRARIVGELETAVRDLGVSATVTTRDDAVAVRVLYDDIENDQKFWNALAALILGAAALAAFNLVNRIVEAQRREIGIGMALGVPRRSLAIRPMLVGAQVALLGVLAGIGMGLVVGKAMGDLIAAFLPMPIQRTPFQFGVYAQAALLGAAVPVAAAAIPVWRALHVEPIRAIRTGHLTAKTSRLTDGTGRIHIPGSSLTQMSVRNILRTPRRTLLTAFGVGAAITALVAVLGMLDSVTDTVDRSGAEFSKGDPERVLVQLETFVPIDDPTVTGLAQLEPVGHVDAGLRLPATLVGPGDDADIDLLLEFIDFKSARWTPTLSEGSVDHGAEPGLVLAEKAADDLGVAVGDRVTLHHPTRTSDGGFGSATSTLPVAAIHVNPMRTFAFGDLSLASVFGLDATTNFAHLYPVDDADRLDLQRAVFGQPGVASSQAVSRISEGFDEALEQIVGILVIAALAGLVLALLIAFNATRITVDERRRELATMRAFGLPVRSVMGTVVRESVLVGVLATVVGVIGGLVFLEWLLRSLASTTLPDIGIEARLSPTTLLIATGVGIVAVALAPLFLLPRVRKMSIPDTLRVME